MTPFKSKKRFFVYSLVLSLSLGSFQSHSNSSELQKVQFALKDLQVEDTKGQMAPAMKGTKIYIFWASWCGVCKKVFPYWMYSVEQGILPQETIFLNTDTDRDKWVSDSKKLNLVTNNYRISEATRKAIMPISKLPIAYIINSKNEVESVYHIWNERSTNLLAKRYRWMKRGLNK